MLCDPDTCPHPDPVDELDGWFRCPRCGVQWNDPKTIRPSSQRARSDVRAAQYAPTAYYHARDRKETP